mgnify:CR=1 FL=1
MTWQKTKRKPQKSTGLTFMAKTYEWIDMYGVNHITKDNKKIWVDEVLMLPDKQKIIFKTYTGREVLIDVWELKIYE